jgi:uncharacterized protein
LRIDLPFRQKRRSGPPFPNTAPRDRDGIRRALKLLRAKAEGRLFAGGHSYGGRQTSILIAEEPDLADGLLLLSYPLHPPRKPDELRTSHFPNIRKAAFFAHGTLDPFGSIDEMRAALQLLAGPHELFEIPGTGHDLQPKKQSSQAYAEIASHFGAFASQHGSL